jgi:Fe-S-cluster containining protein
MKLLTEFTKNECACSDCASACEVMPGWFVPSEVEAAAALLGLPLDEFVQKFCTIDYWVGDPMTYVLRPRQTFEPGGSQASGSILPPEGPCVFLTANKRCGIHAAKPFECAVSRHDQDWFGRLKAVADAWQGEWQDRIWNLAKQEV